VTSLCPNFVRNHPPYTHTHTHTHSSDCGRSYVALYGRKRRKRRNRIEEPLALWQRCPGIISSFVRFFYFLALVLAKNKWNLHDTWVILHVNCFFWQTNKQIHKPAAGGKVGGCGSGSGWNAAIVVFSVFTATQAGRQAVSAVPSRLLQSQVPAPEPNPQPSPHPHPRPHPHSSARSRPFSLFTLSANEFYILGFVCLRVAVLPTPSTTRWRI